MAEVVKVQVQAETKSAEDALRRAQQLADSLGKKQSTIRIKAEGLDGLAKQIKVVENETAKLAMSADTFRALSNGAITAKQAMEDMGTRVNRVNTEMQSFIDHATGVSRETSQITAKTSMFGKVSDDTFKSYTSGAISGADATQTLQKGMSGLGNETQKTAGIFDGLTKRFTAANLVSSLVTAAISKLRQALRQAVDEMKEMDKELTTIKMVTGASAADIAKLREQAFQGARETGRTTADYLSAAERFARAGYRENIQDLTKLSLVTQNVGGVTEDVASKFLLAADAAWKMGGNTERLWAMLDGVSSIADQNATDIGKIAEAYTVAGSAFANAGESERTFAALIGTTTAATQRSGSEMARGLQTILFRVRQVKQELDDGEIINAEDISNAAKALDSVGISVLNDANELKSFSEIMGELNKKWDTLNSKQKAYLQNALAGNRRGNVLFSLMDNWKVFEKQLEQYDKALGKAQEKNETFTSSWEAASNNLKTSWTEIVSALTEDGGLLQRLAEFQTKQNEITAGNIKFLNSWFDWLRPPEKRSYNKYLKEAEDNKKAQEELESATIQVIKVYDDEAEAVDQLSSAFSRANANIKNAAEGMKSEKDDAVKSAADIFKAMQEAAEKGYYGSNKYQTGIQLFFGTKDKSKIKDSAKEALSTYFKEIEKGDYSKAAANLWDKLSGKDGSIRDKNGNLIASMKDLGDSFKWIFDEGNQGIDNFLQSMQESTGISKDFWASFIQSLGMYSDELDEWMEDHKESPEPDITLTVDNEEAKSKLDEIDGMLKELPEEQQIKIKMLIDGMTIKEAYEYVKAITDVGGASNETDLDVVDLAEESAQVAKTEAAAAKASQASAESAESAQRAQEAAEEANKYVRSGAFDKPFSENDDSWIVSEHTVEAASKSVGELAEAWGEVPEEVTTEAEAETSEAESSIKYLLAWLKKIPETVVSTIVVKYKTQGSNAPSMGGGSSGGSGGGGGFPTLLYDQTGGTHSGLFGRAKGKKDSYSGIALVNDEFPADGSKPELIISKSKGRAYIANGGRPALVNLRSDDIVLTAKETKEAVGFPRFETGKRMDLPPTPYEDGGGSSGKEPPSVTTPSDSGEDDDGKKKKKKNKDKQAQKDWEQLKKLVDYLLEKGERELKSQLKVLDKQLDELEAERKQRQEQNQLEEKQLAVQQALVDLEKAQNERTVRYYNEETQQWEWMADQGDIDKAQEALDSAQQDLADYQDDLEYQSKRDAIEKQKQELQDQFDELTQSWADIVDAIEAPAGDLQALLKSMFGASGTLGAQAGSVADLLNMFREGIFGAGYSEGLGRINANTKKSTTTGATVFGKKNGSDAASKEANGNGIIMNAAIGPEFSRDSISIIGRDIFEDIGESLQKIVGSSGEQPIPKGISNTVNNNGGNFYLNGIQIGQEMYNRPFVEVLRALSIHANENR